MKIFVPISKVEEREDGTLFVAGIASSEALDSQGEIVTTEAMKGALPDFFKFGSGNLREMHQMIAAGRVDKAEVQEDGSTYIECAVTDDAAAKKVRTGTYKGFSIGGKALSKGDGVIKQLRLTEISLVDRPANPEAMITMWKADDGEDGAEEVTLRLPADVAKAINDAKPEAVQAALAEFLKASSAAATQEDAKAEPAAEPVTKADPTFGDIAKSVSWEEGSMIWDAQNAMEALNIVFWLLMNEAQEKVTDATQIATLRAVVEGLKSFVVAELQEKPAGETIQMGDGVDNVDMLKAGAKYSKATKDALAKVHGMLRDCDKAMSDMGYDKADDEADKAEKGEGVAELGSNAAGAELCKAANDAGLTVADDIALPDFAKAAVAELAKMKARVTELEAKAAPAKAATTETTAVGKNEDTKDGLTQEEVKGDPNDPHSMFKAALSRPMLLGG